MPKESRIYSVYKRVEGADSLVELISIEETYSQDRALDLAIERIPEADRPGDYAAIVGMKWKPWGERVVKMTGWGEAEAPSPTHRDSSGRAPLPGQTDLTEAVEDEARVVDKLVDGGAVDVKVANDGEPIPEAEVAVEPIPHEIETTDESTVAQAKAKAEEAAEAERQRQEQLAADRAKAVEDEKALLAASAAEEPRQVADGIAAVQERRKAAEAAKRDETPAPVNAPDFQPPTDW